MSCEAEKWGFSTTRSQKPTPLIKQEVEQALTIKVRQANRSDQQELATMRALLWPEASTEEHRKDIESALRFRMYGTLPMTIFVSQNESGALTGFIEVGLRSHADGCIHLRKPL